MCSVSVVYMCVCVCVDFNCGLISFQSAQCFTSMCSYDISPFKNGKTFHSNLDAVERKTKGVRKSH